MELDRQASRGTHVNPVDCGASILLTAVIGKRSTKRMQNPFQYQLEESLRRAYYKKRHCYFDRGV